MINYNNSEVVQSLRQYDMFANSLNLVKGIEERDMIVKQLTKLENKIISLTNEIYEEEYYSLTNKECGLLEEEKNRVTMLIDLINQRLSYVEKRCNNHYQLTGDSIDVTDVLGASTLDNLENRVKIIDKYSKNVKLEKELKDEVRILTSKISLASEKIDINKSLNIELESTFKKTLSLAFEKLELFDLLDIKEEIEYAYYETEKSLTLAELNLEAAKTSPLDIVSDCQIMLQEIKNDYVKYKDKISTLKLMEMFNREVNTYAELLNKRKEVNEIIKYIKNIDLIDIIKDMIDKQYGTILMEQQDINTLNDLILEKERKLEALSEIEEENNSDEFQNVLKVLIENERRKQEKLLEEKRRIEEEEKRKRIELERKKQEEILKRQKIIEEARKKEIEKRTKQLLEQQQNSVLQKKDKTVSFDMIKDRTDKDKKTKVEEQNVVVKLEQKEIKDKYTLNLNDLKDDSYEETTPLFKDKVDIEKELFEEFGKKSLKDEKNIDKKEDEFDLFSFIDDKIDDKIDDNKLPDISIDEYMKNFDSDSMDNSSNLFDNDDVFPNIPM